MVSRLSNDRRTEFAISRLFRTGVDRRGENPCRRAARHAGGSSPARGFAPTIRHERSPIVMAVSGLALMAFEIDMAEATACSCCGKKRPCEGVFEAPRLPAAAKRCLKW